jgi:cobalt-zinc-cadmium efflux system outer membrane protein
MRCVLIAVLGVALGGAAYAQAPDLPARLTLDDALRIAEARNPLVVVAQQEIAASKADVTAASKRPNPGFSFNPEGLFARQDILETSVAVEQEFEMAGRRKHRTEQAQFALGAAQASAEDVRRRLRLDVRRAYMQVVLAKADEQVARETLAEIDQVLAINKARYDQGELSGVELRRLQVERFRFADDAFISELALRNARSSLLALLDVRPLDRMFETADDLAPPVVGPAGSGAAAGSGATAGSPAVDQALAGRPDLLAARREVDKADAGLRVQQALATPNFVLGAGLFRAAGNNGLLLSVGVPLPFFNRNEGGIARGAAEQQQAVARRAATETQVTLDVQQALNAVDVSRRRIVYVEGEYLKNAREARDIILASYRSGAATLIDYLDAQRALREALRTQNRARFDYRISLFQYEAAVGTPAPAQGKDRP